MARDRTANGRGHFGDELRRWRRLRRISQLDLALSARVSQRHISFIETGRSAPSRAMVLQLAEALDVPLRERNALLRAAGYAAVYRERGLDGTDLAPLRDVLTTMLRAYEPYPAYVIDRAWNLVLANDAATALMALIGAPPGVADVARGNVLRLLLHPQGLRPLLVNWADVAAEALRRLDLELAHAPGDARLIALRDELWSLPGIDAVDLTPTPPAPDDLLMALHLRTDGRDLRLWTAIATVGAAYDVTLDELRIETLLPADAETERALRGG